MFTFRRGDTGAQRKANFARKQDAARHAATAVAGIARGTYVDPRTGKITLRDVPRPDAVALRLSAHIAAHPPAAGERMCAAADRAFAAPAAPTSTGAQR